MQIPENPTNKELAIYIQANHEETMREIAYIREQTTKTNGKVADSCKEIEALKLWRSGLVACIALLAFVIPLVINAILK